MRYDKGLSYYVRRALPWWIKRPYDWVADRLWRRHNILKLSYGYGWADTDTKLLYAAFDLLTAFIEKEKPWDVVDWDNDEEHRAAAAEIKALYKWWKEDRPARVEPLDSVDCPEREDIPGKTCLGKYIGPPEKIEAWKKACDESNRLETEWDSEDEFMLHRLIKVRRYLWT